MGIEHAPFEKPLEDLEYPLSKYEKHSPTVKFLPDYPSKVIRVENFGHKPEHQSETEYLNEQKNFFYELRDRYGINIPDIRIAIAGKSESDHAAYLVVDHIEGERVETKKKMSKELKAELEEYFVKMITSWIDAYHEKKKIFHDSGFHQLVYGVRPGEVEKKLYFVDVGPGYFESLKDAQEVGHFISSAFSELRDFEVRGIPTKRAYDLLSGWRKEIEEALMKEKENS